MNANKYFIFHLIKKNCTVVEELTAEVNSKIFEGYVNLLTKYALLKLFLIIHFYYIFHQ